MVYHLDIIKQVIHVYIQLMFGATNSHIKKLGSPRNMCRMFVGDMRIFFCQPGNHHFRLLYIVYQNLTSMLSIFVELLILKKISYIVVLFTKGCLYNISS
jgi:hypothetical protein